LKVTNRIGRKKFGKFGSRLSPKPNATMKSTAIVEVCALKTVFFYLGIEWSPQGMMGLPLA
jgi:hypothetical protein